jgi:NifU-like protein involved in Fe-S cluster formation
MPWTDELKAQAIEMYEKAEPTPENSMDIVAEIAEELALPPVKIHCSILAEDAIKAAVADYKSKHGE